MRNLVGKGNEWRKQFIGKDRLNQGKYRVIKRKKRVIHWERFK